MVLVPMKPRCSRAAAMGVLIAGAVMLTVCQLVHVPSPLILQVRAGAVPNTHTVHGEFTMDSSPDSVSSVEETDEEAEAHLAMVKNANVDGLMDDTQKLYKMLQDLVAEEESESLFDNILLDQANDILDDVEDEAAIINQFQNILSSLDGGK